MGFILAFGTVIEDHFTNQYLAFFRHILDRMFIHTLSLSKEAILRLVVFIILLVSGTQVQACGDVNSRYLDVALTASAILVILCSLVLPLTTMLVLKIAEPKSIIRVVIVVLIALTITFSLLFYNSDRQALPIAILLLAITMFLPTGYFVFKAVKNHVKSST